MRTLAVAGIAASLAAVHRDGHWRYATASAYSLHETSTRQGCPGAPALTDRALSVATFLIGCGRRMVVCYRSRCVRVTRWDSGPFVRGRSIDLNVGAARALLGCRSCSPFAWGVRSVRWRAA